MSLTATQRAKMLRFLKSTDASRLFGEYLDAIEDGTQLDDGSITSAKLAPGVGGGGRAINSIYVGKAGAAQTTIGGVWSANLDKSEVTLPALAVGDTVRWRCVYAEATVGGTLEIRALVGGVALEGAVSALNPIVTIGGGDQITFTGSFRVPAAAAYQSVIVTERAINNELGPVGSGERRETTQVTAAIIDLSGTPVLSIQSHPGMGGNTFRVLEMEVEVIPADVVVP